jgi:hypothetical protein
MERPGKRKKVDRISLTSIIPVREDIQIMCVRMSNVVAELCAVGEGHNEPAFESAGAVRSDR